MLIRNTNVQTGSSVVFDDDGRVCYAYLFDAEENIVGDVWLYSRCAPPAEPEWRDANNAPFANPAPYARAAIDFDLPENAADVSMQWSYDIRAKETVEVRVHGLSIGRLQPGSKPGWARAAAKDGPLAKVM